MVDVPRLNSLIELLGAELSDLRRLRGHPIPDLLSDHDKMSLVRYHFIISIEVCIDIAGHIIASEGLRAPVDAADAFVSLGEGRLLSEELVSALRRMARFRNLLVHQYADVEEQRVAEILHGNLGDVEQFRAEIARLVTQT